MRTPLTYYGGKQMLAARIVAMMPEHCYLEPFAGWCCGLVREAACGAGDDQRSGRG